MQKKVSIVSLSIITLMVIFYSILLLMGIRPTFKIEKFMVLFILLIIGINIAVIIYQSIKKNKILNVIIGFQIELVLLISFVVIIKNMNVNIYNVQKGNNNYLMKVNVNDNSKEYYLYKNKLFVTRNYAIKEYLIDTELSYEEDTPIKIEYNKKLLPNEINKDIISSQKKIIASNKLNKNSERIIKYIKNSDEMKSFCEEYEIENVYDDSYFQTNEIICISYIPFKEVIPFVALGEDDNYYVYIKVDEEDTNDAVSFCFIEIKQKSNVNNIEILDYNKTMKNLSE